MQAKESSHATENKNRPKRGWKINLRKQKN